MKQRAKAIGKNYQAKKMFLRQAGNKFAGLKQRVRICSQQTKRNSGSLECSVKITKETDSAKEAIRKEKCPVSHFSKITLAPKGRKS